MVATELILVGADDPFRQSVPVIKPSGHASIPPGSADFLIQKVIRDNRLSSLVVCNFSQVSRFVVGKSRMVAGIATFVCGYALNRSVPAASYSLEISPPSGKRTRMQFPLLSYSYSVEAG